MPAHGELLKGREMFEEHYAGVRRLFEMKPVGAAP
jgi:hypothetical protein